MTRGDERRVVLPEAQCAAVRSCAQKNNKASRAGGVGGAVGVRILTKEVATYTEFRDEVGVDRFELDNPGILCLWTLCAMSSASGGLGRAKRRRKRGGVGLMC